MATFTKVCSSTPTITTSAYTAKDAVGGLLTFTDAGRGVHGSGVVHAVTIIDKDAESAELVLVLFNQSFTPTADNAAFDPSDADLAKCIGKVKVAATDYQAFNDNGIGQVRNVGLPFQAVADGNLYGQLMCTGTPTYTGTSDLIVMIHVLQD